MIYAIDATTLAKEVAELASPPPGEDEYGHEVVDVANGAAAVPRTVNGTGHTGPSEFCATSI